MKKIEINEEFDCSPEKLFDYLEVHENLADIFFPLSVKTVREGDTSKYGVGSTRELSIAGLIPFEETIMVSERPERIEYTITKGSPLKSHYGIMNIIPTAHGCRLHYSIELDADFPFLADIIKFALENGIRSGLKKLKRKL